MLLSSYTSYLIFLKPNQSILPVIPHLIHNLDNKFHILLTFSYMTISAEMYFVALIKKTGKLYRMRLFIKIFFFQFKCFKLN